MASVTILLNKASVLYTFYPPLTASPFFYIGLVLVVVGSWIWCVLMIVAMGAVEAREPGPPRAARHVRHGRQCGDVAVDDGGRYSRDPVHRAARIAGLTRRWMWA
jgi:hypothetical protein